METNWEAHYHKAAEENSSLKSDLIAAKYELNDKPEYAASVRESKIARQRKALQRLNRRVRVQRLQLRRLNELERGLRPEEWVALKEEFAHELSVDEWEISE